MLIRWRDTPSFCALRGLGGPKLTLHSSAMTVRARLALYFVLLVSAHGAAANSCDICQQLVPAIEQGGCSYAADAVCDEIIWPVNKACSYIVGEFCQTILGYIAGGQNGTEICSEIGFCTSNAGVAQFPCVYNDDSK